MLKSILVHFCFLFSATVGSALAQFGGPQDIIILMDSSGSLGASGWAGTRDFVMRLNENLGGRAQDRIGIIQFATGATVQHNLTDSQDVAALSAEIEALPYLGGYTYTKTAVNAAISMFTAQSDLTTPRLLILITDGPPSPSPESPSSLKPALDAGEIPVIIFGHGSAFSSSPYVGIVDSATQIFTQSDKLSTTNAVAAADGFMASAAPYFAVVPEPASGSLLGTGRHCAWLPAAAARILTIVISSFTVE